MMTFLATTLFLVFWITSVFLAKERVLDPVLWALWAIILQLVFKITF